MQPRSKKELLKEIDVLHAQEIRRLGAFERYGQLEAGEFASISNSLNQARDLAKEALGISDNPGSVVEGLPQQFKGIMFDIDLRYEAKKANDAVVPACTGTRKDPDVLKQQIADIVERARVSQNFVELRSFSNLNLKSSSAWKNEQRLALEKEEQKAATPVPPSAPVKKPGVLRQWFGSSKPKPKPSHSGQLQGFGPDPVVVTKPGLRKNSDSK